VHAVLAHAFGQRYELPIPLSLFVVSGALVVLVSFAVVVRPGAADDRPGPAAGPSAPVDVPARAGTGWLGGMLSVAVASAAVWCGLAGTQEVGRNLLPTLFWLYAWIVVPLTCGLVGDWTRAVNPFAALARWADRPRWRRVVLGGEETVEWPQRLGCWPAVGLYLVVTCGELVVSPTATLPRVTASALAFYAVLCVLAGFLAGPAWIEQGEVFSVLFGTWGRLGYLRFGTPGRRGFAGGLTPDTASTPSRRAFLLLLLVSVNVDGLLATPRWTATERRLLGLRAPDDPGLAGLRLLALGGLALVAAVLLAGFAVGCVVAARGEIGPSPRVLGALMPSLLPIAFGYLLAHNLQYVLVNGQLLLPLAGNPLGADTPPWQLPFPFDGTFEPDPSIVPTGAAWYLAVVAVVAVHVVAVVLAHRHLRDLGVTAARARRAELPWLVAMVGYTAVSLWLLAQPLVQEGADGGAAAVASPMVSSGETR